MVASVATWRTRLTRPAMARMAAGLALGAVGGVVAQTFGVPLAWMLGPLFFCMAGTMAGLPVLVPMWMRGNFMMLIGVFLGESFDTIDLASLARWPISLAGAALYMPVATYLTYLFYRHVVREDAKTAICSSIPGGLTAVVLIAGPIGADERNVALAQSLRIAFVVCMAPFVAFGLMGYPPPVGDLYEGQKLISPGGLALILGLSTAAVYLLRNTAIPILPMICPLIISAILRLGGVVEGAMPHWVVEVALLVLGASIGTRFAGVPVMRLVRFGAMTFGGTAILMLVAAVFALVVSLITGLDLISLLLSYAPGGVAEMSLIAFAIDADPAFVAIHHIVRIILVIILVPMVAAWASRSARGAEHEHPDHGRDGHSGG